MLSQSTVVCNRAHAKVQLCDKRGYIVRKPASRSFSALVIGARRCLPARSQMKAQLSEIKCVRFEGLHAMLKFLPCEQCACDGLEFVRLNPRSGSLISVVCEANDDAPKPTPNNFSLTCCDAMCELQRLRNAAAAKELAQPAADACSLFASAGGPQTKAAKARVSHQARKEQRLTKQSVVAQITTQGDAHAVEMIRPVAARDAIWVRYDQDTLDAVVQFLRSSTFSDQKHTYKHLHDDLPHETKGIHKRANGWVVALDGDAGPKWRRAKDINEALCIKMRSQSSACLDSDLAEPSLPPQGGVHQAAETDVDATEEPCGVVEGVVLTGDAASDELSGQRSDDEHPQS